MTTTFKKQQPLSMPGSEGLLSKKRIRSLEEHTEHYVTTSELAEYWMVSRSQIYKHIEAGTLKAIRLGPRLLRISRAEALDFERRAKLNGDRAASA